MGTRLGCQTREPWEGLGTAQGKLPAEKGILARMGPQRWREGSSLGLKSGMQGLRLAGCPEQFWDQEVMLATDTISSHTGRRHKEHAPLAHRRTPMASLLTFQTVSGRL